MFVYLQMLMYYFKPAFSFLKKAAVVVFTLFIALHLFFFFANKDKITSPKADALEQERLQMYSYFNNPEVNKTDEGKLQVAVMKSLLCGLVGEGCTNNPYEAKDFRGGSFVGGMTKIVMLPFGTPPASGIEWARSGLEHAGFIPQSQAAVGVGLAAVAPFKNLWVIFRNFAFLLMVLIMVVIGFMIMFRAKINAQTVISVENALPKIVIAMILITFSYAIAGLMIDLMYISMGLIIHLFASNPDLVNSTQGPITGQHPFNATQYINKVFFSDQFSLASEIFENNIPSVAGSIYDFIPTEIRSIAEQVITTLAFRYGLIILGVMLSFGGSNPLAQKNMLEGIFGWVKNRQTTEGIAGGLTAIAKKLPAVGNIVNVSEKVFAIGKDVKDTGTPGVSLIAGIITFIIVGLISSLLGPLILKAILWLILMLSLFFVFMRIFFMFISAYIQILLLIIFSPIILAMEMMPGRSAFKSWIQSLFINLITFPLFLIIILVSKTIMATTATAPILVNDPGMSVNNIQNALSHTSPTLWAPPFLWGIDSTAFTTIIAGALLFMAPDLIKSFKAMTGIKGMQGVNFKLGAFFAGGTVLVAGALGVANQYQSLRTTFLGAHAKEDGLPKALGFGGGWKKVRDSFRGKPFGSAETNHE